VLTIYFWDRIDINDFDYNVLRQEDRLFFAGLWINHFKLPVDTMRYHWRTLLSDIRDRYFKCEWYEVYDFIEFAANNFSFEPARSKFIIACNSVLEKESSGYRFVNGQITPITSEVEISAIEQALSGGNFLKPVHQHLQSALQKLSDKKNPDYRNSIKESISAVEAICNLMTNKKGTLGDVLKKIKNLHPALRDSFIKLYGYTSDAQGIRHALLDEPTLEFEDAKFMLVSCSAFINYLVSMSGKSGIKLDS